MTKLITAILSSSLKDSGVRTLPLMAAAGLAAVVAAPQSADAAGWTYNFTFANSLPVVLTLDTTSNPLVAGTVYDISSISGTIGGTPIAGISTYMGASNKFQYDPNSIFADDGGISFEDSDGANWNIYNLLGGFGTATDFVTDGSFNPNAGSINVAGPVAPSAPTSAPGPLPLFGASVAFGMSRQLRRRVKAAS
jgi:hypothetical protein